MATHEPKDSDVALQALQLAADIRRLADRVHDTHDRLLAGHLRRAAVAVEQTYQHLARGPLTEQQAAPDPLDGLALDLGYPQPGRSSGGGSPRRGRR